MSSDELQLQLIKKLKRAEARLVAIERQDHRFRKPVPSMTFNDGYDSGYFKGYIAALEDVIELVSIDDQQ